MNIDISYHEKMPPKIQHYDTDIPVIHSFPLLSQSSRFKEESFREKICFYWLSGGSSLHD